MVLIRESVVIKNWNCLFLVNQKKKKCLKRKTDFCHLILYIQICFLSNLSEQMSK